VIYNGQVLNSMCAVVVTNKIIDQSPKPFRTLDTWLQELGFTDTIKKVLGLVS